MSTHKVAIIGGYGGMGRLFAQLLKEEGWEVTITGPTKEKGKATAKELGVEYTHDNVKAAKEAEAVIITVPIATTYDGIKEVAPHIKHGGLIMDLTSVKTEPCRIMDEFAANGVEILGSHPVFGPRVRGFEGQPVVLTPIRGKKGAHRITTILHKKRARVITTTPDEHDRVMAVVQGLTHFAYISVGKTLCDLQFNVKESREYASPVYDLMLDMIGRIIGQDPHLYAEIQLYNPYTGLVHETFMSAAESLSNGLESRDEDGFVSAMVKAARHFGDVDEAMGRSDKAIAGLVAEIVALKERIGRQVAVAHIYSGAVHLGTVESVTAHDLTLRDGDKTKTLKLSNLRLLPDGELKRLRAEKSGVAERNYSVLLPASCDEHYITELLIQSVDLAVSVKAKDVYTGPQVPDGKKSVFFTVNLIRDDVKEGDRKTLEFFRKIGGIIR
ncbi:Ketol-acid reductoisomerase [uncultured archaeon]|nr:Ketol-acid reductoisomerase [uncultured archaeon]